VEEYGKTVAMVAVDF